MSSTTITAGDPGKQATDLHQQGRLDEAIACYRRLLADAATPQLHYNLGIALYMQGRLAEAIAEYRAALALKPGYAAALINLGTALKAHGDVEAAISSYRQALAIDAGSADAHSNLGNALCDRGNWREAAAHCRRALALDANHAEAHNNLGNALRALGETEGAARHYRRALQLKPRYAGAHANLGHLLQDRGDLAGAITCYSRALQLQANHAEATSNLFFLLMQRCDWRFYAQQREAFVRAVAAHTRGYGPLPFLAASDSAELQRRCAHTHSTHNHPGAAVALCAGTPYAHSRIRLAYMSADLREHAVSYLAGGLFALHDRTRFEVTAIALAPPSDAPLAQRVKRGFDRYVEAAHMTDAEIAQLVRSLEIDVLVDLMGFTRGCRPNVLAQRPAPIQVNYLGFPGTMGAPYVDYIVADAYLIPPGSQRHYSEHVAGLSGCFQVNDTERFRPRDVPSRTLHGLPESGFVFCCFNNSYKITPDLFDCWMRILRAVPASVLWLIADVDDVAKALRGEAAARGVDPARLVFAGRVPYHEYLTRFQLADLFLDTFPFNAGTTASDALWCGVPVLTCSGEAYASRMAGSLLTALRLPQLITGNLRDYEARACALAREPSVLALVKRTLVEQRAQGALFDTKAFCRNLEAAFTVMVDRHRAGEEPTSFQL